MSGASRLVTEGPVRAFGPDVTLAADHFVVRGQRYPRRRLDPESALQPVRRRRPDPPGALSQLRDLPPPSALADALAFESEIFGYISPSMARILQRIAEVDARATRHGFVLLIGPTGCGKTTMAKTYCYLANQPYTELSFSGDTALTDFYTSIEVVRGDDAQQSTLTVPGPAVEAMLRGKKLLLNEINMLPPDLLNVFSQAMDTGRLVLSGTERGNVEIEVHGEFGLIGTANPNYVGTVEMGRAIERRFGRGLGFIEMDFIPPDEEAVAIEQEFGREEIFHRFGITVDSSLCRRLADLAAQLRRDPRIGDVMQSRLSTRTLIHWLGLAQISGLPLRLVLSRAILTTAPSEARDLAVTQTSKALGDLSMDLAMTEKLRPLRVHWPILGPREAAAIDVATSPERRLTHITTNQEGIPSQTGHDAGEIVIHRVRYVRPLDDGGKVLVAEPLYWRDGRWVGLGVRIRAYMANGCQITDPSRLDSLATLLRDHDGVNVPARLGRRPRRSELLPCLTASSVALLELVEAALLLGRPAFLAGPTGSGKSSLARTLAYLRRSPLVEFSFTGETAKTDLSASRRLIGGVTHWQTQAFLEALARGDTVIVNEYNLAYPDVHSLLNSLFDKGGRFSLPDGRVYTMHPGARLVATGYLEGPGVKPLNEGVENRFGAIVGVDYPPVAEEVAILRFVAPAADERSIDNCVRLVDYCRKLVAGRADPTMLTGLSRAAQEALRQAARRAALSTAELVAIALSGDGPDFASRLRDGVLDGATEATRRVLEPVLIQYGLG